MIYITITIALLVIVVLWLSFQLKKMVELKHPKNLSKKIESYSQSLENLMKTNTGRRALTRFFINEVSFKGFLNDLENTSISTEHPEDIDRLVKELKLDEKNFMKKLPGWIQKHGKGLGNKLFYKLNINPGGHEDEDPKPHKPFEGVPTSVAAFLGPFNNGPMNEAVQIQSMNDFHIHFGGLDPQSEASYGIKDFFLNGGRKAWVVRIDRAAIDQPDPSAIIGTLDNMAGLHALENVDIFNMLCFPDIFNNNMIEQLIIKDAYVKILTETFKFCERHRAFFILDSPAGISTPENIKTFLTENEILCNANGAIYFPRIIRSNQQLGKQPRIAAPSGAMAGVYARLDHTRGVWKAPAGTEAVLNNVPDLEYHVISNDINVLNPIGINCLRQVPNQGTVCWGARTLLSSDPEWRYISVKRLALFVEESILKGTQWVVFEPNGENVWSQIRQSVRSFLYTIFLQGGFSGSQPDEAYYVKCDSYTTTASDIQNGILNIIVGIAPINPSEFLNLGIQHRMGV